MIRQTFRLYPGQSAFVQAHPQVAAQLMETDAAGTPRRDRTVTSMAAGASMTLTNAGSYRIDSDREAAYIVSGPGLPDYQLEAGEDTRQVALTSASGVVTVDCSLASYFTLALTENVTAWQFINVPPNGYGKSLSVRITQHASSAKTVAWPRSFRWLADTPGTMSPTTGDVNTLALSTINNGASWAASLLDLTP